MMRARLYVSYVILYGILCVSKSAYSVTDRFFVRIIAVKDYILDPFLKHIGKLKAVSTEYLDTVEFCGIVRRRYHYSRVSLVFYYKIRYCGSWNYAKSYNVRAYRAKSCDHCACKHIRGYSRVAAYNEGRAVA